MDPSLIPLVGGIEKWVQLQVMISGFMPNFDGTNKEKCRDYIADLESFAKLNALDSKETIKLALAKARGTAAVIINRQIKENPTIKWDELKAAIRTYYLPEESKQHAYMQLTQVEQREGELMLEYGNRVLRIQELMTEGSEQKEEELIMSDLLQNWF
jgi:hypothetical protein